MNPMYELVVLGTPSVTQLHDLREQISQLLIPFQLQLENEVAWIDRPHTVTLEQQKSTAAIFFGGKDVSQDNLQNLIDNNIPILPVVSDSAKVHEEIPNILSPLNCLSYSEIGVQRVATALLECVGLLPRQRRVFLSYRRDEARQAALQLFNELSSRYFDVFLDTHGIAPADDFQIKLWHHLCESDVLVMLDTPNYFESRWTSAEFGRALAKGISVLRIAWPDVNPSPRTATANHVELKADEIDEPTGQLDDGAMGRICIRLESVRTQSYAVRNLNLASSLRNAIKTIGGTIEGTGINNGVHIRLADQNCVVAYPTVGVPTSTTLHNATEISPNCSVAVVYDPVGLDPSWLKHLDWLGDQIRVARWVKVNEAAWQFADWEQQTQ